MIDIHAHILPGVDDGARDIKESLYMAEQSVASGVRTMIVTPHANQRGRFENYADGYMLGVFRTLQEVLREENVPLELIPGMEIYANHQMVDHIRAGRLCPLGRSHVYLVEFPFGARSLEIEKLIREMLSSGYVPMIAHPERYACVQNNISILTRWKQLGCYLQMNKDSIWDFFGARCGEAARIMLEMDLVDVIASDAHDMKNRTADMTVIKSYLIEKKGHAIAKQLLQDNPRKFINMEGIYNDGTKNYT